MIRLLIVFGAPFAVGVLVGFLIGRRSGPKREPQGFPVQPIFAEKDSSSTR